MNYWVICLTVIVWFLLCPKTMSANYGDNEEESSDSDSDFDPDSEMGDCPCPEERYEAEQQSGIIKSPNYPSFDGCTGKCIYTIMPDPNSAITLYAEQYEVSKYATLEIYSLLIEDGIRILIPHAKIRRPSSYYYSSAEQTFPTFISAKNAGFQIHFVSSESAYTSFKISFDRYYSEDVCDYPIVDIGKEETVVQRDHFFSSASGCIYYLRPRKSEIDTDEDEFMITIAGSVENDISVRAPGTDGNMKSEQPSNKARVVTESTDKVYMLSHKTSRTDGVYKMGKVTAKLIGRSCKCGAENEPITGNITHVSVRSPGFPDLHCPNIAYLGLLEITIRASLANRDKLRITSEAKTMFEADEYYAKSENFDEHFVIKQQNVDIIYEAGNSLSRRFFEVNVTRVTTYPECSCNFFKDKEITEESEGEIVFPSICTYIYCHYTFKITSGYDDRYAVEFSVEDAADDDKVTIIDSSHTETYDGTMLRRTTLFETTNYADFTFHRRHVTSNVRPTLRYKFYKNGRGKDCDGKTLERTVLPSEEVVITSPGYPQYYSNDQTCFFLISSPEGNRIALSIDEISVENFHDHIKIYKGNTTDSELLATFTAHVSRKVVNVSSGPVLIVFQTDRSTSDRGFHITASAHPIPVIYDESAIELKMALGGLCLLLLTLFAIAVYVFVHLKKKQAEKNKKKKDEADTRTDISLIDGSIITVPNEQRTEQRISNLDYIFN
ncbi:unnamed protein product [Caenorhabditis sp. 36 PRJEB53466]|nr:unnamed protein product [Caenorhabditis sp. 36 PRJEB53466]